MGLEVIKRGAQTEVRGGKSTVNEGPVRKPGERSNLWIPIHPIWTEGIAQNQRKEEDTLERATQEKNCLNKEERGIEHRNVIPSVSQIQELLNSCAQKSRGNQIMCHQKEHREEDMD